jgi:hypothetical protein
MIEGRTMDKNKQTSKQPLSHKEFADLQFLLDRYCQKRQELGQCDDIACAYCNVRMAYDEIFYMPNDVQWDEELFLFEEES